MGLNAGGTRTLAILAVISSVAAVAPAAIIDFDHTAAGAALSKSSVFGDATVLTETYATLGVHFSGPSTGVGGMILNGVTAGFGVQPTSGANFLAFNNTLTAPKGPETVSFDNAWGYVSINVSGGPNTETFRMQAYDIANVLLTTSTLTTKAFATLSVQTPGIRKVIITNTTASSTDYYAYDDLAYYAVPEPTAAVLLAVAASVGALRRRRRI